MRALARGTLSMLALLGAADRARAQDTSPRVAELDGDWLVAIRLPHETVTIFLHVRAGPEHSRATLDVPDVRAIDFERLVFQPPVFRLTDSKTVELEVEGRLVA